MPECLATLQFVDDTPRQGTFVNQLLRVLLVEDSADDAQLVLLEIKRGGYEVESERVETRSAMQAALRHQLWDIIICDNSLPQFSAMEAIALLKESALDFPLIIISGTIGEEAAVAALKAGAHDFLVKGNLARLIPAIQRELRDVEARRDRRRAQEALRESELRFRALVESGLDEIVVFDVQLKPIYMSPSVLRASEYSWDEMVEATPFSSVHPDDQPVAQKLYEWLLQHPAQHQSYQLRLVRKDGSPRWTEGVAVNLLDDPSVKGIVLNYRDITERKRAEAQINYHARLLRHINDAVIATDDQFRITAWNRAAERIYGWTATEVMGRSVVEILRFGLSEEQQAEARELLQEKSSFRNERIHARKNGQPVYVEENTIALTDQHRKITGYVSVNRDITERKQVEEALRENEQLLSEAQRIGHVGSWSYNIVSDTLQYSDEMYRLLDVSPREFSHNSQGFLNLIYPSDHPLASQWMEDIKNGRPTKELNFRLFRKNGELRHIQCRGAIIFDSSGKAVRFTGMAQDITERKLAEIQIRQQIEHLSALRRIDQAITSNLNLHFILNTVVAEVSTQLQVDATDILLLDPDEQTLKFGAGKGFRTRLAESARLPMGEGLAGRAAKERRLIKVENLKVQPHDPLLSRLLAEEDFVSYYGVPLIAKGIVKGVLEVFHRAPLRPYPEWLDFLNTLAGQAAIAIDNATLFENLQASNRELVRAYDTTIEGWSRALDLRDKETEGHTQRVTEMMIILARAYSLPEDELLHIRRGCLLHDIGKMGVPDHILLKPGELTEEEWTRMRTHPQYAYELLKPIPFLEPALDIPYCHHERWDGTGYPRRLKGEEIPLAARMFAIADVWDAVTSDRPYRPAWSKEEALAYIREQSGKYFDPQIVDLFFRVIQ